METDTTLGTQVRALLDAGGGELLDGGGGRFLPLATLESGARVGLDASAGWVLVPEGGGASRRYTPGEGQAFFEVLESKRDDFDEAIEAAARAAGLPAEETAFSFPAADVVRAVLRKGIPYLTRLALQWLRLTELRELRADIAAVARDPAMPAPTRALAERLTVPE